MWSYPCDGYPKVSSKNYFLYLQEESAGSCTPVFTLVLIIIIIRLLLKQDVVNSSQNSSCAPAMQLLLEFLALCTQEAAVVPLLRDLHSERLSKG